MTRRRGDRSATAPADARIPDAVQVDLPHNVAVELLAAAVSDFAELHGVRTLVIKGRVLADQGLRAVRGSSDVDVLVDPAAFERLWGLLRSNGWTDRDKAVLVDLPREGSVLAPHARTLEHPHWPCHLDLHRYYPGFLKPAQSVFDTLWEARSTIDLAHRKCSVPAVADHWLIAALHSERSRDVAQLKDLEQRSVSSPSLDLNNLAERAIEMGAEGPLRDILTRLTGQTFPLSAQSERLTALWRKRIYSEVTLPETLLEQLREASWPLRICLLARKLAPSRRFVQAFTGTPDDRMSMMRFYVRRWGKAPRKLIQLVTSTRIEGR